MIDLTIKKNLINSLIFVFLGFIVVLFISLYRGTSEFNYYCQEVQRGNPEKIYFRGKGLGDGEFTNCKINTITLDYIGMFFGLGLVAFLAQTLSSRDTKKKIILSIFISLFLSSTFTISFLYFPKVMHGFLEGGTWLSREVGFYQLASLFSPYPLIIFFYFIFSQSGPLLFSLLNRSNKTSIFKNIIGASISQVIVSILLFLTITSIVRLYSKFYHPPIVTPKIIPYPQSKTINVTIILPSPGIKSETQSINSN